MKNKHFFSKQGKNALDSVEYKKIDVSIKDSEGNIIHKIKDAMFPKDWTYNTCRIVASKYFSRHEGKEENSAKQMVNRITSRIKDYAITDYKDKESAEIFKQELDTLLINQFVSFNSPVWFNMGNFPDGQEQLSACFCLRQEDSIEDLLRVQAECVHIYRKGSGTGQLNKARASKDVLKGGGMPSGPMAFIRARDSWAESTKSGGITRRAAAMELMDCDHADIFDFIEAKAIEEEKAFLSSVYDKKFQNSNFTVRLIDGFWERMNKNKQIHCLGIKGQKLLSYKPEDLLKAIAKATWRSGDPGLQFMDTIRKWSTYDMDKHVIICNPCGEYLGVEDSSCNLASLNVSKFVSLNTGHINKNALKSAVFTIIEAMDLFVHHAKYPTEAITKNAIKFRPLGLGFCNLGATLMMLGIPYDSKEGRAFAAEFTALMNYYSIQASALLARKLGVAEGYNHELALNYLDTLASDKVLLDIQKDNIYLEDMHRETYQLVKSHGMRNTTTTSLAPTGTISFKMGADSTGCEPLTSLITYKHLADEETITLNYECVDKAKAKLIRDGKYPEHVKDEEIFADKIFETAFCGKGSPNKALSPKSHIDMVASLQPFIMMGISKTCNVPEKTTVEEIQDLYIYAHKSGLKSITIYRDNSKSFQVLTTSKDKPIKPALNVQLANERIDLPEDLPAIRHKVTIGGHKMRIIHCNFPNTNKVAEVFTKMTRDGSTLSGLLDAFVKTLSIALQHGVPFESFYKHLNGTIFEPKGFTSNPEMRGCTSIIDYIMKYLKLQMGGKINGKTKETSPSVSYAPFCHKCGSLTIPDGTCFTCPTCGAGTGCGG
jgi:ribonucleoside-diphosphate reductase alpha chain